MLQCITDVRMWFVMEVRDRMDFLVCLVEYQTIGYGFLKRLKEGFFTLEVQPYCS